MNILLVAATTTEIQPTLDFLAENAIHLPHKIDICITGVGLVAATFSITKQLMIKSYEFAVQAGIGGAYDANISLGEVVLVKDDCIGDLGVEDHEQFIDIFTLGFDDANTPPFSNGLLSNTMAHLPQTLSHLPQKNAMTVNTASGYGTTIARRQTFYKADIESMEGAAFHYVCLQMGVPFTQIRSISNHVTPRDRSSWQIGKAIGNLNKCLKDFLGAEKS